MPLSIKTARGRKRPGWKREFTRSLEAAAARDEQGKEKEQEIAFTRFVYRNQWFVLNQTEGAEYQPEPLPDWDETQALAALSIERTPFDELDGNIQGFATGRKVAINPIAAMPAKTLFHELAHVVLGHTAEGNLNDGILQSSRTGVARIPFQQAAIQISPQACEP